MMLKNKRSYYGNGNYSILFKGELAGAAGFNWIDEKNKIGEIRYWIAKDFSGVGIMTRSVKMLENLFFKEFGFNRIVIRADERNIKSKGVPERLKYHLDGIMREDAILPDGCVRSTPVYSKLKSEWDSEHKDL
ncbi:MAG: GNAT family N-acetyltransferase [Alphaproteobacteria bacterium]|nr:GNAT family N-acetyltransferase [Alphaproteobacteria bacterium]